MVNKDNGNSKLDNEVTLLFNNAKERIRSVEKDTLLQKKQIVTELAKSLEGKISTDTICIEIKYQLRGEDISERHIEECLDEKYKQVHRVKNARKRNSNKSKLQSGSRSKWLKIEEEKDLAAPSRLNEEYNEIDEEKDVKKESQKEEIIIVGNTNGQMLIQSKKNNGNDDTNDDDNSVNNDTSHHYSESPLNKEDNPSLSQTELQSSSGSLEKEEITIGIKSSKCSDCVKKNELLDLKNDRIEELEQVIRESDQLVSADKLVNNTPNGDKIKKPIEQDISCIFAIPFEELRRDMAFNNRAITSNLRIIFSGYICPYSGKTSGWRWEIKSE